MKTQHTPLTGVISKLLNNGLIDEILTESEQETLKSVPPAMLEALETVIKHGLIEQDGYSTTVKKVWDAINQAKGL